MGTATESTKWPEIEVPDSVKQLIDRLFTALDSQDSNAGSVLAHEIFAADGIAYFGTGHFQGTKELERSRDNAWTTITFRRHTLSKVYVDSIEGNDLAFIGHVTMELHNGKIVSGEFTGRIVVRDVENQGKRVELYKIWADSQPLVKALQSD
ncbi:hypothetical protein NM208_g562 [Fusarium decemcellulare]|uniref:Uncharacterized protein n=2 Tax=Fusarium decemcellulare TaxID=57161 RepID=A0ACC1SYM9_9HYPO|nr:hypothetical protein NM208_g751 [Fusarium decemcellulare]KAJ3549313.1 hypothetical protein NM208_g562 [Fusarium decemcellulare]